MFHQCGGEESDDDLMDINAAIRDYGLDSDTGSDDFWMATHHHRYIPTLSSDFIM